jgi:hypothetical protein
VKIFKSGCVKNKITNFPAGEVGYKDLILSELEFVEWENFQDLWKIHSVNSVYGL